MDDSIVLDYFSEVTSMVGYMRNYYMIKELNEDESTWSYFLESNIVRRLYTNNQLNETDEINELLIKIRILQLIHYNSMKFIETYQTTYNENHPPVINI